MALVCHHCGIKFPSKTKLFKHLRSDQKCNAQTELALDAIEKKVCVIYGYMNSDPDFAEAVLRQAIEPELSTFRGNKLYSRASKCLQSDRFNQPCPAAYDVLTYRKVVPPNSPETPFDINGISLPEDARIFASCYCPNHFDADKGIMQRTYVYLVPFSSILPTRIPITTKKELSDMISGLGPNGDLSDVKPLARFRPFYKKLKSLIRKFQGYNRFHNYSPKLSACMDQSEMEIKKIRAKKSLIGNKEFVEISFIGRKFLVDQINRIVGVIIAICREILPDEFAEFSLQDTHMCPVPAAPSSLLFMNNVQYWKEFHSVTLFCSKPKSREISDFGDFIRHDLATMHSGEIQSWAENDLPHFCEEICLPYFREASVQQDLSLIKLTPGEEVRIGERTGIVQRYIHKTQRWRVKFSDGTIGKFSSDRFSSKPTPECYESVLKGLKELSESGQWPETSSGRKKVIEESSQVNGGSFSMGFFPLVPPRNDFLELMKIIFELELKIAPHRPPSSTVAINRRAQFKPHYDKGDGNGQTQSLIVGLGNYAGGELVVEGEVCDIQYKPLEFNGCTQRHWTKPFEGDRFSLVFFTPVGCEGQSGLEFASTALRERKSES